MTPILLLALMLLFSFGLILIYISKANKSATDTSKDEPYIFRAGDRVIFKSYYRKYDIVIRQGTQATIIDATQATIPDAAYGPNVIISVDGFPLEMLVPSAYLQKLVENQHEFQYNK